MRNYENGPGHPSPSVTTLSRVESHVMHPLEYGRASSSWIYGSTRERRVIAIACTGRGGSELGGAAAGTTASMAAADDGAGGARKYYELKGSSMSSCAAAGRWAAGKGKPNGCRSAELTAGKLRDWGKQDAVTELKQRTFPSVVAGPASGPLRSFGRCPSRRRWGGPQRQQLVRADRHLQLPPAHQHRFRLARVVDLIRSAAVRHEDG